MEGTSFNSGLMIREAGIGASSFIVTKTTGCSSSRPERASAIFRSLKSGSFSISKTTIAPSGIFSSISGCSSTYLENSLETTESFSKKSLSVIFCLLKKSFHVKLPVYFNICISKIKSIIVIIHKQRGLINRAVKVDNIPVSKSMCGIIANYWAPFIFDKYFKLNFKLRYFVFNPDMVMSLAAIFRVEDDKFLFSNHNTSITKIKDLAKEIKGVSWPVSEARRWQAVSCR